MGTNCVPLVVADLFLFCYERDFLLSLSEDNQSDVIEAFNSTSRYLDDLSNIVLRWPKWLTFHFHTTSQFRIPNSEIRYLNSEFRNS